jgi:hypothetical protein
MEMAELSKGKWVRFTRYHLVGDSLQPASGVRGEKYDPFEEHSKTRDSGKVQTPYGALIAAARAVPESGWRSKPASLEGIIDWCNRFGLLGLLPHRALLIVKEITTTHLYEDDETGEEEFDHVSGVMYSRSWLGWKTWKIADLNGVDGLRAGVLWKDISTSVVHLRPLSVLTPFSNSPDPDQPLTGRFWLNYREPVDEFVQAAKLLARGIESIARRATEADGIVVLNTLAEGAHQEIGRPTGGKTFQIRWRSPSLLSALATMALLDLLNAQRVLICACCKAPFISTHYQSKFCSTQCRHRCGKREQRKRMPKNR